MPLVRAKVRCANAMRGTEINDLSRIIVHGLEPTNTGLGLDGTDE